MAKYYPVFDNGGIPFVVKVSGNQATVFDVGIEYEKGKIRKTNHVKPSDEVVEVYERVSRIDGKQIFHLYNPWVIDTKRIFIAKGEFTAYDDATKTYYAKADEEWEGNTILIETGEGEYTFIGLSIFSFHSNSPIQEYRSIVGNSAVPYPFAISKDEVFLLGEDVVFPLTNLIDRNDPYSEYYAKRYKGRNLDFKIIRERTV